MSKGWSRDEMAARLAQDIPEGWYVNLGIGIPTRLADHVPPDREIIFQSENGLLGFGRKAAPDAVDPWVINAGKEHVTLLPGAALFHHADAFQMIRGGHLDLCVLGGYQVAPSGDLANWATDDVRYPPAVGGAMDLAVGAQRIWVLMEHSTREGQPRLLEKCVYPLTAPAVVQRVYTDLAVMECAGDGFRLIEMAPGADIETLRHLTGAPIL